MPKPSKSSHSENIASAASSDPRFSKVLFDPRFRRPKKKDVKLEIDERFASMLDSNEFGSSVSAAAKVDKYGRKKKSSVSKDLKKYYRLEEKESRKNEWNVAEKKPEEEQQSEKKAPETPIESDAEEESDNEISGYDLARGEGLLSSSDEEDLDSEDEGETILPLKDEDAIDATDVDFNVGPYAESTENIPTTDETHRFAAINMDWDNIKARDLLKVFDGFKPKDSYIKSVNIYTSDFGKERLEKEAREGPPKEIFSEDKDDEDEGGRLIQEDEGKEFNTSQLRKYQMDRLRYYYAVVECDSVSTATAIYKSCDGSEFEASGNFFDLRFIPDDMTFDDDPVDTATNAPVAYQPIDFVTQALQHSRVKLTWDSEDPERFKTTRRKFTKDDLKEMDFKSYLASSSSEEDEEDLVIEEEQDFDDTLSTRSGKNKDFLREKYRSLLLAVNEDGEQEGSEDQKEPEEMEITFVPGLSEKANQLLEKKKQKEQEQNETAFESYLRKKKEKKKARKRQSKDEADPEDDDDDMYDQGRIDGSDPFFQVDYGSDFEETPSEKKVSTKSKKQQQAEDREASEREKANLELLMMNDNEEEPSRHFDMKDVLKEEKDAKKKKRNRNKKKKMELGGGDVQEDFDIDVKDNRFSAIVESHHFAIDPTHPSFKKTKAMSKILDYRRNKVSSGSEPQNSSTVQSSLVPESTKTQNNKSELDHLVAAVKRKSAAATATQKSGKRTKTQ